MKKACLLVMLLCVGTVLWAQKTYFIYIQSDTHTPFYVKMGGKVFSASSSGYLILSQLHDSTYNLQLGPSATDGELQFSVPVRQADRGLLLKKFSDGWGLFDLQTLQVIRPTNSAAGFSYGQRVRDDQFTHLLAEAADDTTLFYQPILASTVVAKKADRSKAIEAPPSKAEPEQSTAAPVAGNTVPPTVDTVVATTTQTAVALKPDAATVSVESQVISNDSANTGDTVVAQTSEVSKPVVGNSIASNSTNTSEVADTVANSIQENGNEAEYKKSKITRRAESSTVDGFGLVYWDETDGVVDTIQIFIPNQKFVFAEAKPAEESDTVANEAGAVTAANNASDKKTVAAKTCSGKASDKDFFRIRKSLVAFDSEIQMVIAARSSFRNKCFSSEQIKNLSTLFLTQEGKWQFLEAAYPHVPDKSAFSGLQSELRDEPYISRFKALIGK